MNAQALLEFSVNLSLLGSPGAPKMLYPSEMVSINSRVKENLYWLNHNESLRSHHCTFPTAYFVQLCKFRTKFHRCMALAQDILTLSWTCILISGNGRILVEYDRITICIRIHSSKAFRCGTHIRFVRKTFDNWSQV